MSAQEFYRGEHASRPLSSPTSPTHDMGGNLDHHDAADVDERPGGVPERVTSPDFDNDKFNTRPSPSPERNPSAFSDPPGYGKINQDTNEEEGNNPYGKNYNMANRDSKEPLVPGVRDGRSNGYQDLGGCPPFSFHLSFPPTLVLILVVCRVRGGESSQPSGGASYGP